MPTDQTAYVTRFKSVMQSLQATPTCPQHSRKKHIHSDLSTCTHVFVRHDAIRKTLQAPYDGPYKVLQRADKYFTLDMKGKQETTEAHRCNELNLAP